jgi:hypothetical protein
LIAPESLKSTLGGKITSPRVVGVSGPENGSPTQTLNNRSVDHPGRSVERADDGR